MSSLLDFALVTIILSNLAMLGTARFEAMARLLALQGLALGAITFLLGGESLGAALLLAVGVAGLKGVLYPWVLTRVIRRAKVEVEEDPIIGYTITYLSAILGLGASIALSARLALPVQVPSALALPVALSTVTSGVVLTISRRAAVSQVIGYVLVENGVFLFGLTLVRGLPVILELGAMLEVFFAVFVMGIALDRIRREFDSIDVERLDGLKG